MKEFMDIKHDVDAREHRLGCFVAFMRLKHATDPLLRSVFNEGLERIRDGDSAGAVYRDLRSPKNNALGISVATLRDLEMAWEYYQVQQQ